MSSDQTILGQYFSDVMCLWAFVGQIRINQLCETHGDSVSIDCHFVDVFGDVPGRLQATWKERGGMQAYAKHVQEVIAGFEHVSVHPEAWTRNTPTSSTGAHAFLHAVGLAHGPESLTAAAWRLRQIFFLEAEDISARAVQLGITEAMQLERKPVEDLLDSGKAFAVLSRDSKLCSEFNVEVSPTLIFDGGRQVLKGNVGFRVIDANVQELKRKQSSHPEHSWC